MKPVLLYGTLVLGAGACTSQDSPTQPTSGQPSAAAASTVANSWSTRAAYPGPGLYGGSVAMAPNAAGQPIVYLLGGTQGAFDAFYPVRAYNAATNSWLTKGARVGTWQSNGAGKIGNRIYYSGGLNENPPLFNNQTWAYDYTGDRLIRKADLPIHSGNGVSGVIDGKLYVLPGQCDIDSFPAPGYCSKRATRRFFRYDPAANRWVTRPWAPHFHAQGAAGVIGGKLYVVGGGFPSAASADLDVYDPATNTWKTLAPIPTAGRAIGAVIAGKFFVITGSFSQRRSYEYNPGTNTWRARAAPSLEHEGVVRVTLDGKSYLLAAGGGHGFVNNADDIPNASELYTR